MNVQMIALTRIVLPPELHRVNLDADALATLADSIQRDGLLQPIIVEPLADQYLLRAGHRRLLAHQMLRATEIAANVREPGETTNGETVTWVENLERADLSPMEQARAINRAHNDHGITLADLARQLHRSEDWIQSRLDLYALPDDMAALVHTGDLPIRHALMLATISDTNHRSYLMNYTRGAGASADTIKEWVRQWHIARESGDTAAAPRPAMPEPGQPPTVTMPCHACGDVHNVYTLHIVRVCRSCAAALADTNQPGA